jgi:hypothetical protein
MRLHFDRSREIDAATIARNVEIIMNHSAAATYSEEEELIVRAGTDGFNMFEGGGNATYEVRMPASSTKAKVALVNGDSCAWGWSSTIVPASPEKILAHAWDTMGRSKRRDDDLEKSIDESPNEHHQVVYNRKRTPKIIDDRDFLGRSIWKKMGSTTFVLASCPLEPAERRLLPGVVRASFFNAMKITKLSDKESIIEYVIHPDFGGKVPKVLTNWYIAKNLDRVTEIRNHFQELRSLEEYDAADGRALGLQLMHPGRKKNTKPWEMVQERIESHAGLREFRRTFPWLKGFLEEAVRGQMARAKSVKTKLDCLSEAEARRIGHSLSAALRARKTADAGLYQWEHQNRSMVELFERFPWTRDMMLAISQEVLRTAPWGLAWRVGAGALLSVADMASDFNVINIYFGTPGSEAYGWALLSMVGTSILLQLLVVLVMHWKKKKELPGEIFVVLIGMKAPYDALRVVQTGKGDGRGKHSEEQDRAAGLELAMGKCCEMCEFAVLRPGLEARARTFIRANTDTITVTDSNTLSLFPFSLCSWRGHPRHFAADVCCN